MIQFRYHRVVVSEVQFRLHANLGCRCPIKVAEVVLKAAPITCGLCGTDLETTGAGGCRR